jgi:hypothetical protein
MANARDPIARLKDKIKIAGWGITVDETMSFVKPELAILFDVWRAKVDGMKALPRREDLDIRLLKPFLRHVSVVERFAGASGKSGYRIRLQGSFLVEHFGDQTGKTLDEAVPGDLAERWGAVYDAVLDARRPLRVRGTYEQEQMDYLVGESLNVPLGNGDAPPVSVMSVTYYTPRYKDEA